jgi:uncharacterized metal-binding protein YceD (DUF177 family)
VGEFSVNIIGLGIKAHEFNFSLGKAFFEEFGKDLLEGGQFEARVVLDKHETFIEATFNMAGTAKLICDRSLEPFDFPLQVDKKMVFKYGAEEAEITDEIIVIPQDKTSLNLGQYMYEYITLALPMKRIHPKFQEQEEEDDDETEGKIIYTSQTESENEGEGPVDPRWEVLKKLKK